MDKFNAFVRTRTRDVLAEKEISLARAIDFLKETENGVCINIETLQEYQHKEELENVKSVRSKSKSGTDHFAASRSKVHEDSYRELFETARNNTESSSKRNNKRD